MNQNQKILVIGGGAWGTALAQSCQYKHPDTTLWVRRPELVKQINTLHKNTDYLPDCQLSADLHVTATLAPALERADIILLAIPTQKIGTFCREHLSAVKAPLVICAKGLALPQGHFLSDVVRQENPSAPIAILSGPGFAEDLATHKPTALTLACADEILGQKLAHELAHNFLRLYWSQDVIGVEIGGAIKNVIAIATGIAMGRKMGDGARAALITRALIEISRLGSVLGAQQSTAHGLSGLGDLVLTCSSTTSRNTRFGMLLGQNLAPEEALKKVTTCEGYFTAAALHELLTRYQIDMPICQTVYEILYQNLGLDQAILSLLNRPLRPETAR